MTGIALSSSLPDTGPDNGLSFVHDALLNSPRTRRWVIAEVVNSRTTVDHDTDGDVRSPLLRIVSVEPVTEPADIDQLRAMRANARAARGGQLALEDT